MVEWSMRSVDKGSEFESVPYQISTAHDHRGFHILSPENGLLLFLMKINNYEACNNLHVTTYICFKEKLTSAPNG